MPPKKKDPNGTDKPIAELQADHELFLQAFEKPTQIYRFLRTRNLISPIFLHRTLYYMKGRMSRNHKNRGSFKSDDLLAKLQQKTDTSNKLPGTFLNIVFSGFFDKKLDGTPGDVARIETHIVKICYKKRKESVAPLTQFSVGSHDVAINPLENSEITISGNKSNTLNIPTYHFTANNGHQVKSYVLVFRVSIVHDQENVGEPLSKRRRISRNSSQETSLCDNSSTANSNNYVNGEVNGYLPHNGGIGTCYGAELIVYDRHGRCQLTPGQYELVAHQLGSDAPPPGKTSPKKNVIWESLDSIKLEEPFQELQNSSILKFNISWTEDNSSIPERLNKLRPLQPLDVALANSGATKPKPQGVASPEAPQLVLYQFIYNNNSRQQTEARYDFHCPWCSLKCCALYSLLKHLKLCHARFSFTYVPHPKGARIDVSLNECYDGSYAGNPQDLVITPTRCSFSRSGPTRRSPTTSVLVCLPKRSKPSLSEFLEQDDNDYELPRSYILGHNRLYHHTMTCLPVQPHELDEDSEGEHDSNWVRTKTRMMIDDFSDVNEGEKDLMKLWNLHVMKHNYVGDCQLPLACYMFIENHGVELLCKNLYRNFTLHMASLHDFGLVGSGVVYNCVMMLQKKFDEDHVKETMLNHWQEVNKGSKRPFSNAALSPPSSMKSPNTFPDSQRKASSEVLLKRKFIISATPEKIKKRSVLVQLSKKSIYGESLKKCTNWAKPKENSQVQEPNQQNSFSYGKTPSLIEAPKGNSTGGDLCRRNSIAGDRPISKKNTSSEIFKKNICGNEVLKKNVKAQEIFKKTIISNDCPKKINNNSDSSNKGQCVGETSQSVNNFYCSNPILKQNSSSKLTDHTKLSNGTSEAVKQTER